MSKVSLKKEKSSSKAQIVRASCPGVLTKSEEPPPTLDAATKQKIADYDLVYTDPCLFVFLEKGTDLIVKDPNGLSDPYVKLTLGDGVAKMDKKSKTINKNLNPEWSECYEMTNYSLWGMQISFTVWDKDLISKDDFMGVVPAHNVFPCGVYAPYKKGAENETVVPTLKTWWKCEYTLQKDKRGNAQGSLTVWYYLTNLFASHVRQAYFQKRPNFQMVEGFEARLKQNILTDLELEEWLASIREEAPSKFLVAQKKKNDDDPDCVLELLLREMIANSEKDRKFEIIFKLLKVMFDHKEFKIAITERGNENESENADFYDEYEFNQFCELLKSGDGEYNHEKKYYAIEKKHKEQVIAALTKFMNNKDEQQGRGKAKE
mmetsp:Transcript_11591/g.17558  ORF Transcript_11591/g.17558 Transcript_11591/m.17558 type:complete len:376 (-) Transcript_11591:22-1149(-)|eukprot:CAMPEP_0201521868 /NCGR_PEP_ID=MMETSP0161_2-20130828/16318_1 /ASSEMBLY_ACC=CAM_ASM_000251 /TAXON_ID=180227 /ORGANISM="Neoparamoeba aestuarina, Strain SoJaBio B1-5/56/2" /LENGTH=375 /DNA_ID=CAMNT_0047920589 /DNA_START=59 /DNA_END=1186 /DNA_ORIENTATION=+